MTYPQSRPNQYTYTQYTPYTQHGQYSHHPYPYFPQPGYGPPFSQFQPPQPHQSFSYVPTNSVPDVPKVTTAKKNQKPATANIEDLISTITKKDNESTKESTPEKQETKLDLQKKDTEPTYQIDELKKKIDQIVEKPEGKKEEQKAQKEEAQKEEAQKEEAQKEEAQKEEAQKEEAQKEEAQKEEAQKEEAQKEEAQKEEAQKEEAQKEEVVKEVKISEEKQSSQDHNSNTALETTEEKDDRNETLEEGEIVETDDSNQVKLKVVMFSLSFGIIPL